MRGSDLLTDHPSPRRRPRAARPVAPLCRVEDIRSIDSRRRRCPRRGVTPSASNRPPRPTPPAPEETGHHALPTTLRSRSAATQPLRDPSPRVSKYSTEGSDRTCTHSAPSPAALNGACPDLSAPLQPAGIPAAPPPAGAAALAECSESPPSRLHSALRVRKALQGPLNVPPA
jgi:hypothetical protein